MPLNIFAFGTFGSALGQFRNPRGIAVHYSTGNIFVCDTGNDRIQKYTRAHGPITTWPITFWGSSVPGDLQLTQPWAIAVDASTSDVYVSDKGNNRIKKFTAAGKFILQHDGIWSTGMAVDHDGNVYASIANEHKVYKFSSDMEILDKWGHHGSADGEFSNPHGIVADTKNEIYVVDTGNFRIQKFTNDGEHIASWRSSHNFNRIFRIPYGIAFDGGTNSVHVSDNSLGNIQTFTQDGGFIRRIDLNQP